MDRGGDLGGTEGVKGRGKYVHLYFDLECINILNKNDNKINIF